MAPGKNTCVQGSHSWGRSPVRVQVVIRSLQVYLKALSTATVTLKRRVCLQAFLTQAFLSHARGKALPGDPSTCSRSLWMLLGPQVALEFLPAYYYALPADSVLQQI